MAVQLVPFDRTFLERSWDWLQDPEIKRLTLTPDFTREDQQRFFDSLPSRSDYRIWGVALNNKEPIGAAGLKNMRDGTAEYWGYIGRKILLGPGTRPADAWLRRATVARDELAEANIEGRRGELARRPPVSGSRLRRERSWD